MPGVVIVTYNSSHCIGRCLDACGNVDIAEIVVVDNASHDSTVMEVQKRPGVRLIANATNRGFAAAVNQGFESLSTEVVLILNPDTIVDVGVELLEAVVTSESDIGAGTGTLLGADSKPQHGFNVRAFPTATTLVFELLGLNRIWPSNPVNRRYRIRLGQDSVREVDQPAGAFLMVKNEAWRTLGGFDEAFYPVWFEDVDFCKRLRDRGFRTVYVPAASAFHSGGDSVLRLAWEDRQQFWYGSLLRYASKHYSRVSVRAVAVAVIAGCIARTVGRAVIQFNTAPLAACSRVVRLTWPYLRPGDRRLSSSAACSTTKESKSRF